VLYWVVKGKTNKDIGEILGSSPATAKKHLERVYVKLGVETRTAAAGVAIKRIRELQPQFEIYRSSVRAAASRRRLSACLESRAGSPERSR